MPIDQHADIDFEVFLIMFAFALALGFGRLPPTDEYVQGGAFVDDTTPSRKTVGKGNACFVAESQKTTPMQCPA